MGAALALLVACALGAPDLEARAALRAEVSERRYDPEEGDARRTDQLLLHPDLQADLVGPDARLGLAYRPRIAFIKTAGLPDQREVLHDGAARLTLLAARPWRITLEATGALGRTDLVTQFRPGTGGGGTGGGTGGEPPPVVTTTSVVDYQNASLILSLAGPAGRASDLSLDLTAHTDGGATAEARQSMPTQRTAEARALWIRRITPRDGVELRADALWAELPDLDTRSATGTGVLTWTHRFSRTWDGRAGAGAVGGWFDLADETTSDVYPAGELGLSHRSADLRAGQDLRVRLGAGIDRLTGEVAPEQTFELTARWRLGESFGLSALVAGGLAQQELGDTRRGNAEVRGTWEVHRLVELDLGLFGQAQRANRITLPSFDEWGAYLGATLRTPVGVW
ncbi:MAG: hypothetical protein QM767_01325 [Anaeromyxobacter sp.]